MKVELSIAIDGNDDAPIWYALLTAWPTPTQRCCGGHASHEDAIDHGASLARRHLAREVESLPPDTYGAQILAQANEPWWRRKASA